MRKAELLAYGFTAKAAKDRLRIEFAPLVGGVAVERLPPAEVAAADPSVIRRTGRPYGTKNKGPKLTPEERDKQAQRTLNAAARERAGAAIAEMNPVQHIERLQEAVATIETSVAVEVSWALQNSGRQWSKIRTDDIPSKRSLVWLEAFKAGGKQQIAAKLAERLTQALLDSERNQSFADDGRSLGELCDRLIAVALGEIRDYGMILRAAS